MTCLKESILQISRGKLMIKITQSSVNHPLTCHRCKCRRCGACHLECSSSAGTGCKETKVAINDLCNITPIWGEKQVLLEYSFVGVNPQVPSKVLCPFLLSWTLQLPPVHSSAALQSCTPSPWSHSATLQQRTGAQGSPVTSDGSCCPYSSTPRGKPLLARDFIWPQNKQDGNSENAEAAKAGQTVWSGIEKTTALLHFRYTITSMILLFHPDALNHVDSGKVKSNQPFTEEGAC